MSDLINVPSRYVITDLDPIMQPDPIGAWVHMEDYHAQTARIEELEAELAKAIDFVLGVGGGFKFGESLVDWANLHVLKARTLLAELSKERSDEKGETDE